MANADDRAELRAALKAAVDGEQRFGMRVDVRPELDSRWDRVIDAIEKLCLKMPPNRKR